MNIRFLFYLIIFWFLLINNAYSQDYKVSVMMQDLMDHVNLNRRMVNPGVKYDGSPYLDKEFSPGTIYYNNKLKFENVPLRYNIFNDEMEFEDKNKGIIYAISSNQPIDLIIIKEDSFITCQYYKEGRIMSGFFKVLYMGEISLLAKKSLDYLEAQAATPFLDERPGKFQKKKDKYYYRISDKNPQKIRSIKKMIQALNINDQSINEFCKKEKISSGNSEELIRFFKYIEEGSASNKIRNGIVLLY